MRKVLGKSLAIACFTLAFMSASGLAAEPVHTLVSKNTPVVSQETKVQPTAAEAGAGQKLPQKNNPFANQGLVYTQGKQTVDKTLISLKADLKRRGIPVFAQFDHSKNAKEVGLKLRPTTVLVFGAPKVGTGLMQLDQSVATELPLRISVWEDAAGRTWLAYPRLATQMAPYDLKGSPVIGKMAILMEDLVRQAAKDN